MIERLIKKMMIMKNSQNNMFLMRIFVKTELYCQFKLITVTLLCVDIIKFLMKLEYVDVGIPQSQRMCCVVQSMIPGSKPLFTKRPKRARAQSLPLFSDPSMELPAYETDQSDRCRVS